MREDHGRRGYLLIFKEQTPLRGTCIGSDSGKLIFEPCCHRSRAQGVTWCESVRAVLLG